MREISTEWDGFLDGLKPGEEVTFVRRSEWCFWRDVNRKVDVHFNKSSRYFGRTLWQAEQFISAMNAGLRLAGLRLVARYYILKTSQRVPITENVRGEPTGLVFLAERVESQ